ncbi:MAG: restriction endonuclease subunit S, partial [Clostridioides difficile]
MVDEAKILDVVSISGENVKKFDGERSYLSTGNLDFNKISNLEIVTYENKPSRANQTVNIGEVIFAKMKDTKKTLVINKTNKNIIVSTGFYVLKPSKEILPQYLYHYLNSSYFLNQKNRLSKGATQSALNNEGLANIKIRMYNLKVQEKVVRVLDKAQELIDKRKEQIEVLDE